jgi:hypothetical protein
MSFRKIVLAGTIALCCAVPAHAEEGAGLATQFAGDIFSTSEALVGGSANSVGAEQVAGQCTYTGQTTLTGSMQYQYAGETAASSTSQSQPELTVTKCTLWSYAQGLPGEMPTQSTSFEAACPGAVCVSAGMVTGWPVRPVVVCVDGYTIFGPTPVKTVNVIHACKASTL